MNINSRKLTMTLTLMAGAMLVASLPAGAQVLGGGITGAASGMLGGSFGTSGMQGAGSGAGSAGLGTADSFGTLRDHASQTAGRAREATAGTAADARSRADSVRGTTAGTAQTAHSAGVEVAKDAKSDAPAPQGNITPAQQGNVTPASPGGDLLLGGSASAEKHAMGRSATAHGAANSETSANRSGFMNSSGSQADIALTRDEPAPAATTPAQ